MNSNGTGVGVFYIHTGDLNTPTKMTEPTTNVVVWRWDHDPYGNGAPNEDPDGNGLSVNLNLRFAGQYYDQETGLSYNYFRDYDPAIGRYVESDLIGLKGGFNTYGYSMANPLLYSDPFGLEAICKLLFKMDEKMQERKETTVAPGFRVPWMTGTPQGVSVGPGSDMPPAGGRMPRATLPGGRPSPSVDWGVQFGWWQMMEYTEWIIWTQYDLWKKQCEETSYDDCGQPHTTYWFDQEWLRSGYETREKSRTWTEPQFVPGSSTYPTSFP
jgi:RHS repeat-associated protein